MILLIKELDTLRVFWVRTCVNVRQFVGSSVHVYLKFFRPIGCSIEDVARDFSLILCQVLDNESKEPRGCSLKKI